MPEIPVPPPPVLPVRRWERVSEAAARAGLPSADLLVSELGAGRCSIRVARLGKRGMLFVASEDVDAWARRLAAGLGAAP